MNRQIIESSLFDLVWNAMSYCGDIVIDKDTRSINKINQCKLAFFIP
jgi:hypothetical protein